ncbi:RNA polymerase-associated protein RapA [bioreactor metagenome]|uniref:Helicase conserved C-terminal domain n=2 Tax=root TaxID=1 RepID=A0A0S7C2E3_9BACT|nr:MULTISPECIES: helicase-related protein [Lentimicrobium]MEA5109723.1 helicase-related protein [Lentimicrobium sp.]GAP44802.1 helicase conserved C-terminal domain [Lentimicrobium saccharophilum]
MPTKFFTNQNDNSLLKKFEGVFTNIESIRHFDALVGYFRTSGYFKVRAFLDKIPKIRILVGINVDQLIKKYHDKGQLYLENPDETKADFLDEIIKNIQEANYDEVTEKGILQFIDDLVSGKIELRAHPKKKIHAKVYIFRPATFNEYAPCEVITGSSNLTDAGLGANPESNYEFNVSLREYEDVKFATEEFERLWAESVPILQAEAERIKNQTYLRDDFTPFELYIKMLIEYFGKRVDYDPYNIDLLLPPKYIRLKYQSDAANQGYAIMMKHNGFVLADVVGLGKTIIACMIIKKFIYENGTHTKVLVVVPPAIEDSWRRTVKDFELDNHFTFITLGSLHKILDRNNYSYPNPEEIDLIAVDESHKFRNDYTEMYLALQEICKMPRSRAAENGDSRKKVILISATPLNNRPQDIENQLYLFQDRRNSTLENIRNLQEYFKPINEQYKKLAYEKKLNIKKLKALFQKLRDDVVEPLVIRRTRTDIESSKEYLEDLEVQGIKFPKVGDPIALYYELDGKLSELFFDTVSLITNLDEEGNKIDGLGYYRYRAIEFLSKEEDKKMYGNVESISGRLSAIMKTLLVKRLESSFYAFTQSLSRFQKAIDNMLAMFDDNRVFIAPDLDINKLLEEGLSYDEIEAKINERGGNNKEYKKDAFDKKFVALLKQDKEKVDDLIERWSKVKKDPKLIEFAKQIQEEFFKPNQNISGKLIIFSESKETAEELTLKLSKITKKNVLTVSAENRKYVENTIRDNFDANLEEDKWQTDYDIIITTEVLAEGINLHRSNVIVNYDVPWNSTRLMQRIGRVNRIGSRADKIYVYNYYPSAHGDAQIHLVNNALRKLQAFHTAFGEDNKVFSILEEKGEGALFGNKIQKEESEILKYLNELRDFRKKHPKIFNDISKIPNKARCGRKLPESKQLTLLDTETGEVNYPLQNTSFTYLKSENHPGIFCLITPEMNIIEMNFLQAVKIFKAPENEKAIELHDLHHKQTLAGLEYFKSEKNQENVQAVSRKNLSPAENKAISNINAIIKVAPTEQKRMSLIRVLDIIKKGTFASKGLPKSINDYFTSNATLIKEPDKFIDKLFITVLDRYDLSSNIEEGQYYEKANRGIVNPQIVLTQSFS